MKREHGTWQAAAEAESGPSPVLRVVTYNVYRGRGQTLDQLARFLEPLDADVICLQEILGPDPCRPAKVSPVDRLARALGRSFQFVRRRGTIPLSGGNAILTRQPAKHAEVLKDAEERPFALAAVVEHVGIEFALICAHLAPVPQPLPIGVFLSQPQRTAQVRRLLQWLRAARLPGVVAGDFNAMPWTPSYRTIARCMTDCSRAVPVNHRNTRPTWGLPVQLDYIFVSEHFRPVACRTIDHDGSDHRPVLADLEWAG